MAGQINFDNVRQLVTAELHPQHVTLKTSSQSKNIPYEGFVQALLTKVNHAVQGKINLPMDYQCYSSVSLNNMVVVAYIPEHVRAVKFAKDGGFRDFTIPFPNTVLYITLTKGTDYWVVSNCLYYMTKAPRRQVQIWLRDGLDLATKSGIGADSFAVLSMPNIYGGATICLGGNTAVTAVTESDYSSLSCYADILLNSPFSRDLTVPSVSGDNGNAEHWLKALDKKTEFPYSLTSLER